MGRRASGRDCGQADPGTRAAFVATNSIVQGESVACLWKPMTERGVHIEHPESTLADIYDPLLMPPELRKAHKAIDAVVNVAYGRKFADEASWVACLFSLYERLTNS